MSHKHRIQNFQKIKILGQGTYGKCYLVKNIKQNQLCVLKQIQIIGMNQQQIQQTMKQARILQALDHPNIIRCIQAFVQNNMLNILMDYADGGDLSKKIKNTIKMTNKDKNNNNMNNNMNYFSQNQILNWFTQICLAIKHVHDRKIIHRDLKSQNIFLTSDNLVKLGDFGIAKPLQLTLQKIKTVVGTPYYMSPQICQNKQYSLKTDIWSLGAILYQMCALKPPFDANSLPALALKITRGEYGTIPNHYSKQLKKLINDLLQVDPSKRPNINDLFKYPIIKGRIQAFLPQGIRQRQFSHTTLHSKNIFQRDDLKKDINKFIEQNSQISSIISPRSQGKNMNIKIKQVKQKNSINKKKGQNRRRQISQPNMLTPRGLNNERKIKSNISLTNLQKRKSDKQKQKQQYFKKKKQVNNCNNEDLQNQLSEIKQIRGQVYELHQQLSLRGKKQNQFFKKAQNKKILYNNFIKQEQQSQNDYSQPQLSDSDQSSSEYDENALYRVKSQSIISPSKYHTQKNNNNLVELLEDVILKLMQQKELSKKYTQIQENYGFILSQNTNNNKEQNQDNKVIGLISLLYGFNNFVST